MWLYVSSFCNIKSSHYEYELSNDSFLIYLFLKMLYIFQAVSPPIIRSTQLYKQLQVLLTVMIELKRLSLQLTIPDAVRTVVCS